MSSIYKSPEAGREIRARYAELLQHWPVANEQIRLSTSQGETFVIACGPREAPPLVLLHGSLVNSAMWMGDVAAFAEHFRVYAVDVIGEPGLSAPSRPALASDAHARWLNDVMAGLSLQHAAFVGVSLGGWLALDYATRYPERVDQMALFCPGGVGRQRISVMAKVIPLLFCGAWGARKAGEIVLGPHAVLRTPSAFTDFLRLIHRSTKPRMVKLPIFTDTMLARLTMPVLAIVGEDDALFNAPEIKQRLEKIGAEVRSLSGCGHLITGQTEYVARFLVTHLLESCGCGPYNS